MTRGAALLTLVLAAPAAVRPQEPPPGAETPGASRGEAAVDERLRQVQERRAALARELTRLRSREQSLLGEVERLELEERLRAEELREIRLLLDRCNAEMDQVVQRVRQLERSVEATRPVLAARARALYKLGELSYLRLLLSVDRPTDFFRGYRFVTALARRDNQRMAAFRSDLASLATSRADLERRTQEALALRADLERARRNLEADRRRKTALLTQIVEKKETHSAYLEELEEAEARLHQLLSGLGDGDATVPIAAFRGSLPWPVDGRVRVSFGRRKHPRFDTYTIQNGIELEARAEAPVRAVHEGTVVFADRFLGYGLMIVLDHGGKHHSLYAHLGETSVRPGQRVAAGDTIGAVGAGLEGPSLYFEMRFHGRPEDPADWLKEAPRR